MKPSQYHVVITYSEHDGLYWMEVESSDADGRDTKYRPEYYQESIYAQSMLNWLGRCIDNEQNTTV